MLWRKRKGLRLPEEATPGLVRKDTHRMGRRQARLSSFVNHPSIQGLAHCSRIRPVTHFKD